MARPLLLHATNVHGCLDLLSRHRLDAEQSTQVFDYLRRDSDAMLTLVTEAVEPEELGGYGHPELLTLIREWVIGLRTALAAVEPDGKGASEARVVAANVLTGLRGLHEDSRFLHQHDLVFSRH